jgi:hypothetical protein
MNKTFDDFAPGVVFVQVKNCYNVFSSIGTVDDLMDKGTNVGELREKDHFIILEFKEEFWDTTIYHGGCYMRPTKILFPGGVGWIFLNSRDIDCFDVCTGACCHEST